MPPGARRCIPGPAGWIESWVCFFSDGKPAPQYRAEPVERWVRATACCHTLGEQTIEPWRTPLSDLSSHPFYGRFWVGGLCGTRLPELLLLKPLAQRRPVGRPSETVSHATRRAPHPRFEFRVKHQYLTTTQPTATLKAAARGIFDILSGERASAPVPIEHHQRVRISLRLGPQVVRRLGAAAWVPVIVLENVEGDGANPEGRVSRQQGRNALPYVSIRDQDDQVLPESPWRTHPRTPPAK